MKNKERSAAAGVVALGFLSLLVMFVVGGLPAQKGAAPGKGSKVGAAGEAEVSTTQQHMESQVWWPTMSSAPLEAYTGSDRCLRCHADERSGTKLTSMQRAASGVEHAELLQQISAGDGGRGKSVSYPPLIYELHADKGVIEYTVTNGNASESQALAWVMGAGDLGQTFVYDRGGRWYQSRMSAYAKAPLLDVTTGLKIDAGTDLGTALGSLLTPENIRRCFSCHTVHATSSRGFNPLHAELGLGCEACHEPGAVHAKKMTVAAGSVEGKDLVIFNPASLSPAASIDFCGACHRTFGDVTEVANKANDSSAVRFQPYRLEKSRCWRETQDTRLTCVACHNPHEPLNRNDLSYDRHCLSCHGAGVAGDHVGEVCQTGAKSQCVSCHMPKVPIASMHGEFTDHFIHVVKSGEGFTD